MGRPRTEMTDKAIEAILRGIRLGLHPERAAQAAGVSVPAFKAWRRRHPEFVSSIKEAEATAEQGFLARILRHTEKQWTAAAWVLERRWPDRWRRRDGEQVQVSVGKVTGPPAPSDVASLEDYAAQFAAAAASLRRPTDLDERRN